MEFLFKSSLRVFVLAFVLCQSAYAVDLLGSFERAKENDPEWAAAKSTYLAQKQSKNLARSGLLPNLTFSIRSSVNSYESDSSQLVVSEAGEFDLTNFNACQSLPLTQAVSCGVLALTGVQTGRVKESYKTDDIRLNLTQPLFQMDRWYEYKKGKRSSERAEADFKVQEQELALRVVEGYLDVLRAKDDLRFANLEGKAIEQQLLLAKRRYEQGVDAETEYFDAQAASDIQKVNISVAKSRLDIAYRDLARVTGFYDTDIASFAETFPVDPPEPADPQEWLELAVVNNAQLQSAFLQTKIARNEYKKQQAGHYPSVQLFASYNKADTADGQGFIPGSESGAVGFDFQLPLYRGGGVQAARRQASHLHQQSKDRLAHQRLVIESTTLNTHRLVNTDSERVKQRLAAIESTRKALEATKASYRDGSRNILDVLRTQSELYRARRDYSYARHDYILNSLRLKQVAGVLSEEDIVSVNRWLVTNAEN